MESCETKFSRIFESGKYLDLSELSDSNIRTDDGCNFAIHRVILARSSDYFRRMIVGLGKRRRKFKIPGISGECLSEILCYIYTEDIQVTERNIRDLIIGADYLLLEDLQKKIQDNTESNLTKDNCFRVLLAAQQIGDVYILEKCFRFIQTRFEGLMRRQKDELVDLPLEILKRFLSNRSLNVYNEATVWQAIVAWTQKDIPLRMAYVPQLLLTLSMEEVGEELATEILQHEIISENCYMKDSVEITSSNDSTTNLLTLLRSYSNRFNEPILSPRFPLQLFVTVKSDSRELYITYDENTNVLRKITEMNCSPDVLIAKRHYIYIIDVKGKICKKFDLIAMGWVRMESFRNNYYSNNKFYILAADAYIYVLGITTRLDTYELEVYDTVSNRWYNGVPLRNISLLAAVALENKIYVVGRSHDGMTMRMFDSVTQNWLTMSPPHVHCSNCSLLAYHQKIYLIGRLEAEVFDPATNLWKQLPPLLKTMPPRYDALRLPKAMVIHDQIMVIYGFELYVRWNKAKECWEDFEGNDTINDIYWNPKNFNTVDDSETIRMITKQNRDPEAQLEDKIPIITVKHYLRYLIENFPSTNLV